jgi:hypothetical protein
MRGYQFARRAFLASLGGAVGFEILLGNLEAQAEGLTGPPRLLLMHWPLGTHAWAFLPNGGQKPNGIGTITQWSPLLQPFADAGLQNDMTVLWGLKDVCVGNGAVRYRSVLEAAGAEVPPDADERHLPRARFHALLAHDFGSAEAVEPLYLRVPDADRTAAG